MSSVTSTGTTSPSSTRLQAGRGRFHVDRRHAAVTIAVTAWVLALLALVLWLLARPPLDENMLFFLVDVTVACTYGTVAGVTLARRSHPVPWLLALTAVGGGLAAFSYGYQTWAAAPGWPFPSVFVEQFHSTAWVPGTCSLFLVVPWLVRDRRLGAAWWGVGTGTVLTLALTVAAVLGPDVFFLLLAVAIVFGLATAGFVELRRRRGLVEERNGLGWLALGTATLAVSFLPLFVPWEAYWLTPLLHLASQTVFPAAVLVVVLRNRMWGLGLVVSRAVLAGSLTAGLLGLYLAVTFGLAAVLPGDRLAQIVGAGVVAVAVQPARVYLAARVRQLVYGDASDPGRAVRRLGSQLVGSATVEELFSGLVEDIGRSMRLESVTVSADGVAPSRWGVASEPPTVLPLLYRGEDVGTLAVSPRPGESLSARDEATLQDLCSVVAAAVAVARSAADVEALRGRLAEVRLEERRVIRREIHDGIGPSLAGIRLGLQGARNLLEVDPASAAHLLSQLQDEIDGAVAGVRTLSHHLLPPVLDELGLGAALTELGARYADSALRVTVDTERFDGLDAALAVAAYGIVSEATTNALRHSGAGRCWITARATPDHLVLEVADDGVGLPEDVVPGVGLRSMRERAAEQGGTLEIGSRDGGGTVVRAVLSRDAGA